MQHPYMHLQVELEKRGLSKQGVKKDLQKRLVESFIRDQSIESKKDDQCEDSTDKLDSDLKDQEEPVEKDENDYPTKLVDYNKQRDYNEIEPNKCHNLKQNEKDQELESVPESQKLIPIRKITIAQSNTETEIKKRKWGDGNEPNIQKTTPSKIISSNLLKDLIPDIKPLLDNDEYNEKNDNFEEKERLCELQPSEQKTKDPVCENMSEVLLIANLVRPFTVSQLKTLISRTGNIVANNFWIDKIKSKCIVAVSSTKEAEDTISALNGVKWPNSNPKTLIVTRSSYMELNRAIQGEKEPQDYKNVSGGKRRDNRNDEKLAEKEEHLSPLKIYSRKPKPFQVFFGYPIETKNLEIKKFWLPVKWNMFRLSPSSRN